MKKHKAIWMTLCVLLASLLILGVVGISTIQTNIKRVDTLEPIIEKVLEEKQMTFYKPYIKGIIYTETEGKGIDVMQSSESKYGKRNRIQSQTESIEVGISFFKQAVMLAKMQHCDIWTAVQAYNFGLNYISFVAKHGGKNTVALAEQYSREVLSSKDSVGNTQRYRYWHVNAFIYNGGYLYKNGGNFFYAERVQQNMMMIHWMNKWRNV